VLYKDGKKNGIKKQYAWSGYCWLEESFKNDVLDGPTRRYDRNGQIVKLLNFKNGKATSF
jgi:antitoxin component YwqK of YwqJK toxin-antitoxin module